MSVQVLLLLSLLFVAESTLAINVDIPSALTHRGPSGSYFGFSVDLHKDRGLNWYALVIIPSDGFHLSLFFFLFPGVSNVVVKCFLAMGRFSFERVHLVTFIYREGEMENNNEGQVSLHIHSPHMCCWCWWWRGVVTLLLFFRCPDLDRCGLSMGPDENQLLASQPTGREKKTF